MSVTDYKNGLISVNANGIVNSDITTAISNMKASGATETYYGMDMAQKVFANNPLNDDSNRQRVVVLFTDGDTDSTKSDVINQAKQLKSQYGATVYCVGFGNEVDTDFLKRVSSDYDSDGRPTGENKYYMSANNQEELNNIFVTIAGELSSIDVGEDAVLTDTLSEYFSFPAKMSDDNLDGVTVQISEASGNEDSPDWGRAKDASDVRVSVNGDTINVTGFDYSANAVAKTSDGWQGQKLILTFPIEIDSSANWDEAGYYDTNTLEAGLKVLANDGGYEYVDDGQLTDSPNIWVENVNANGTDVTVQVYVDGVKSDSPTSLVAISRNPSNDGYTYFKKVSESDGTVTYDFNYEQYDCIDLLIDVNNDNTYVLQGVESNQSHGQSGTSNVKDNKDGTYTIDNVTAVGNDNDPDCKIYLSTKYSVKYFDGENASTDATAYIAPATEIVKSTTGEDDGPAKNKQKWMSWKNSSGYATFIAELPALPTAAEGYTAQGWYLGSVDKTETTYEQGKPFDEINSTSDKADGTEDHVIEFYATSKEDIPTPPDVAELLKNGAVKVICANEEANHYADFHEKTYGLLKETYEPLGDVSQTQDGGYQYQIQITDLDAYVAAFNGEEQLNGVQHTNTNNPENTTITFNYSKDDGWALQAGWQPIVIETECENPAVITDFSKSVVTKGTTLPNGVSAEDYALPEVDKNGNLIAITATEGDKVKLLYAITVAGENTIFTVKDQGATLVDTGAAVEQDAETGYITGEFEGKGTVTFYVSKEFTVSNGMTELPNSAAVYMPNEEKPEKEDDSDVPVEVIPDGPSDQEVIKAFGGIIKIDCDGGYYADKHTEALFTLVKGGFDCTEPAKGDDGVYYVDVTVDPSEEYMDQYVVLYNASEQSGGVKTHTLISGQNAQTLHLMYDAENEEWKMVGEETPILFKVTCPNPNDLESIEKTVVSSKSDAIDAEIMGEYDYPTEGKVQVSKGENVTLLYKITVTGDAGATFKVTDKVGDIAAELVSDTDIEDDGDGNFTGTIPENGEISFYVSMNFGEINESTTLHNAATVANTGDGDIPEKPESSVDVDVEVPPTIPTDKELEVMLDGKITVDCLNSIISPEHPDKVYGLVDEDHYKVSELTQTTDGKYTFTVELVTDEYIADYNKEIGKEHKLSSGGEYKFTLTWDGNKWIVKPDEGLVIKVECEYGITGIDKFLVADSDQKEATGLTEDKLARFTFPDEKGRINLPKDGKVTLLYGITVTGDAGEEFTVTDENAVLTPKISTNVENLENGIFTGTIPEDGSITFYVEKVFTIDDVKTGLVENEESLVNVAEITEGDVIPGKEDDEEIVPVATGYSLTYEANGGYFASDPAKTTATVGELNPAEYPLWTKDTAVSTIPVDENGKELAKPTHAQAAPPEDTVISDADLVDVELIGWTTEVPESAGQIYAAGDKYPTLADKATIKDDNVTVYAVWGYDENNDGVADATQIVITPADITIYSGGTGYEGVLGENGELVGTEGTQNGLPEPGYYFILPYQLNEKLGGATNIIDLSGQLHLDYVNQNDENDVRGWNLELYNKDNPEQSMAYGKYVYRLIPETAGYPVRLEIKDGNTLVSSDNFTISLDSLSKTYSMKLYTAPEVDRVQVTAQIRNDDNGWVDANEALGDNVVQGIARGTATLTIRGTTEDQPVSAIQNTVAEEVDAITAVEPENVDYYINGSKIPVVMNESASNVQLLNDTIVNESGSQDVMENAIVSEAANDPDVNIDADYAFDFRYLDLVDTDNGNAYVTMGEGQEMTIYWPYPEGMDMNDTFYVAHFDGLDREFTAEELNTAVTNSDLKLYHEGDATYELETTEYGIKFTTSSFSPFALVYDASQADEGDDNPPYYPWHPDGDDDGPSGLNTEDHFSYVVGYAEDYRTGEATDNEDLWPVKPNNQITRAEVATIFYRLLEDEVRDEYDTTTNDFSDVTADSWYNQTVSTLARMGIVKGYEDGTFRPNEPITRAEFGAIATRFFAETGATYEPGTFTDVTGNEWFANAIQDAVNLGLIGGYPDGTVRPNNNITRAEACAIVNRTLGRVPDADHLLPEDVMKVWPDNNPTDWFYADMQEATNGHEYAWIEEDGHEIEEWTNLLDKDWTDR